MSDAAGSVKVVLTVDAVSYSAALDKANSKIKQFGQAAERAGHASVSSMQASSAALRTLSGGMDQSIRAAERFIAMIPGVGKALQVAFPVIGGIALAGVFVRIGEEAYKAIDKVSKLSSAIAKGFDSLTSSGKLANDQLALTNLKLQDQLDKLEHKPAKNGAAEALAEAKVKADELYISLMKDNEEVSKLLDANQVNLLGQLMGKAPSDKVKESIEGQMEQFQDIGRNIQNGNPAQRKEETQHLKDQLKAAVGWIEMMKQANPNGTVGGVDFSGNYKALDAFESLVKQRYDNMAETDTQTKLQGQVKGAGEHNSAQAQLLKQDEEDEKKQNAFNKLTINEEIKFWSDRIAAFTKGGEQYIAVQNKISDLIASRPSLFSQNKANQAGVGKSTVEGTDILSRAQESLITRPAQEQSQRSTETAAKYDEIQAKAAETALKAKAAYDEQAVSIALAQGTITQYAAATATATIHDNEHAAALKKINDELARQIELIDQSNKSTEDKAGARLNAYASADAQTAAVNGQYATQQQADAANKYGSTAMGQTTTALNALVNSWDNMTQSIISIFSQTMSGLNDDLAKAIVGQKGRHETLSDTIGKTLNGTAVGLAKTGLQKGEGAIGKLLGFGGGLKASHVIVDNWPGGGTGGGSSNGTPGLTGLAGKVGGWLGGLFGHGGGGATSAIPDGGGYDFGSDPLSSTMSNLPWLAGGGDVMAGHAAIIGEKGPELFVPKSSGTVVPNGSFGGDTHNYNIDASGSHDPALTEAAVRRALHQTLNKSVRQSVSATREGMKRQPRSQSM